VPIGITAIIVTPRRPEKGEDGNTKARNRIKLEPLIRYDAIVIGGGHNGL